MNENYVSSGLQDVFGEISLAFKLLQKCECRLSEMGTFNRSEDLQYRERHAPLSRLQGELLLISLIIYLYPFSLRTYPLPQAALSLLILV